MIRQIESRRFDLFSKLILILSFVVLLFDARATAQTVRSEAVAAVNNSASNRQSPAASASSGGWTIAAFVGASKTLDSSLIISQPVLGTQLRFDDVRFEGRSFEPPLYYGYRGGYFLRGNPGIGFEAEFVHLKVYSDAARQVRASGTLRGAAVDGQLRLDEIVQAYSISHGVNLLLFNLAARYRPGEGTDSLAERFIFTARFGLGPTIPHTESVIEGAKQEQYEWGRLAWQIAGETEFRLWRGLHLLGEYKFTRTRQRGKIASGEAESLIRTHHGVFGLSYHF